MKLKTIAAAASLAAAFCGCDPECPGKLAPRTTALDSATWQSSSWLSVKDAPVFDGKVGGNERAADGTSWFVSKIRNSSEISSAKWMVAGLGVFDVYVNGKRVGNDFLKPGFTHYAKTKYAFTYDITRLIKTGEGEENAFAAEVSAGWWRDKIVTPAGRKGFVGRKSAFRGVLEVTYSDGSRKIFGTNTSDWKCGIGGPVTHAAIFDGEFFDARIKRPTCGCGINSVPEVNTEFKGDLLPSVGAEIRLRCDKAMKPVVAYCWKGAKGVTDSAFGEVVKTRTFDPEGTLELAKGETLVVDFGQNAAAVPFFRFRAKEGTVLTVLPGEMLNDRFGQKSRGNDGPEGSLYRVNLRGIHTDAARAVYTFAGEDLETYLPRFTFFGYRYLSMTATDDVEIETLCSVPVTSIKKCQELGTIETGVADVNKLISNVYWGQLSNYLSVPTDCPQRNERLGWTADTQVFCEAGAYNADTRAFFHKWMRDMRDSTNEHGSFPGVAPTAQYGELMMQLGWADAGVIVPWTIWRHFGDVELVNENWDAMVKYVSHCRETKYEYDAINAEARDHQWADWLSYERLESAGGGAREKGPDGKSRVRPEARRYWDYLGACYWAIDSGMMCDMARATGHDAAIWEKSLAEAKAYLKAKFFSSADGMIDKCFRDMQTPAVFALKLGLVEGEAKAKTLAALRKNIEDHGGCLQTGFLGTSFLMETLTDNGAADVAYTLLLQHKNPSWLYSVDQGATTIWERWNSYTLEKGFGPVGMNSFNHYAYGAVLAWIYRTAAGIAPTVDKPGFGRIIMKPQPDRRLGRIKASYKSAAGLITSAWNYDGDNWIWDFTVPEGATALVTLPGETGAKEYAAGDHHVELVLK